MLSNAPRGVDAVERGHLQIHEHHVRLQLRRHRHRLLPVDGKARHGNVGLVPQDDGEPLAHDGLVVGDENMNYGSCHCLPLDGTQAQAGMGPLARAPLRGFVQMYMRGNREPPRSQSTPPLAADSTQWRRAQTGERGTV